MTTASSSQVLCFLFDAFVQTAFQYVVVSVVGSGVTSAFVSTLETSPAEIGGVNRGRLRLNIGSLLSEFAEMVPSSGSGGDIPIPTGWFDSSTLLVVSNRDSCLAAAT